MFGSSEPVGPKSEDIGPNKMIRLNPEQFEKIPDGTRLVDINGHVFKKGDNPTEDEHYKKDCRAASKFRSAIAIRVLGGMGIGNTLVCSAGLLPEDWNPELAKEIGLHRAEVMEIWKKKKEEPHSPFR